MAKYKLHYTINGVEDEVVFTAKTEKDIVKQRDQITIEKGIEDPAAANCWSEKIEE